jgi:hypothetical protein
MKHKGYVMSVGFPNDLHTIITGDLLEILLMVSVQTTCSCIFLTEIGKMSTAERLQLMGHQDPSDKIYKRWYQSRHFSADVGSIYRGKESSRRKEDILCMHPKRDPQAPTKLPKKLEIQLYAEDKELQDLLEERKRLKQDPKVSELGEAEAKARIAEIRRHICRRKCTIYRQKYRRFRQEWFQERPREILLTQGNAKVKDSLEPTNSQQNFGPHRLAVIHSLYPSPDKPSPSRLVALEHLIAYCMSNERILTKRKRSCDDQSREDRQTLQVKKIKTTP